MRLTEEGVFVYSPLVLPFLNSRLVRRLNVAFLVYSLNKIIKRLGVIDPILWIYLPTWTVLECIRRIPHRMLVYNSIDALGNNPAGVSRDYDAAEMVILKQADLVLTTSEALYKEKVSHNSHTYWVPSGVDASWFEKVTPASEVEDLPSPRIGFFGAIDHRFDLDLVRAMAQKYRSWTFVMIGAVRCDISDLLREENVHFLGSKPHSDLVRYVSALDVLFLPYVIDGFTRHIQPAKLYECMALGKPVVATRLPALEPFEGLIHLAEDRASFEQALKDAVAEQRPDLQEKRIEMARANSWDIRYREILKYMKDVMP